MYGSDKSTTLSSNPSTTMILGYNAVRRKVMELTDEAKYCVLVFGYVWLEMISLCVMSFLYM